MTINQVITNGTVGTGGGCTVGGAEARCLARTLNAGGTILYTISGQVVASAGSTILNTATVSGNIKNKGVASTDTELTTVRPGIDLNITKADSPDPVCASSLPTTLEGGAEPVPVSPPLLAAARLPWRAEVHDRGRQQRRPGPLPASSCATRCRRARFSTTSPATWRRSAAAAASGPATS